MVYLIIVIACIIFFIWAVVQLWYTSGIELEKAYQPDFIERIVGWVKHKLSGMDFGTGDGQAAKNKH